MSEIVEHLCTPHLTMSVLKRYSLLTYFENISWITFNNSIPEKKWSILAQEDSKWSRTSGLEARGANRTKGANNAAKRAATFDSSHSIILSQLTVIPFTAYTLARIIN